jgi:Arc/MetJ-type ribon-helix-helix transcriptional regulator
MSSAKIAISLAPEALKQLDQLVAAGVVPSRSKLIQDALEEKMQRLRRVRLAQECAKLEPLAEQAAAEEHFLGEAVVIEGLNEIIGD